MNVTHRWWPFRGRASSREQAPVDPASDPLEPVAESVAASGSSAFPGPFRLWVVLGLTLALLVALGLVALNQEATRLSQPGARQVLDGALQPLTQAWGVRGDGPRFPEGAQGKLVSLPMNVALAAGLQRCRLYRFHFDLINQPRQDQVLGALIDRACSSVEVHLNGVLLYSSGRMNDPYTRQCFSSHVVALTSNLCCASETTTSTSRSWATRSVTSALDSARAGWPPCRSAPWPRCRKPPKTRHSGR